MASGRCGIGSSLSASTTFAFQTYYSSVNLKVSNSTLSGPLKGTITFYATHTKSDYYQTTINFLGSSGILYVDSGSTGSIQYTVNNFYANTEYSFSLSPLETREATGTLWADYNLSPMGYTVTLNGNGGTFNGSSTKIIDSVTSINLEYYPFTRTGYNLSGWKSGSTIYSTSQTVSISSDKTFTAQWSAKTYTLTYNANGGTNAPSSQTITYGQSIQLSSVKPNRTGYTFLGWANSSTAVSPSYYPGGSYSFTTNTTLYAVWQINEYSITFFNRENQESSTANSVEKHPYNSYIDLTNNRGFLRSGYDFLGWANSEEAAALKEILTEYKVQANNIQALYALWEIKSNLWVYQNGKWRLGLPYVYHNGKWCFCLYKIYRDLFIKILQDFEYTIPFDSSTATIIDWKETYQGELSNDLVIPNNPKIIL